MDFSFAVSEVLPQEITCIDGNLVPEGYEAEDRSSYDLCQKRVSQILDKIGMASAIAQNLQTAVTSSQRLGNSDHRVYLLTDPASGANGEVIGLLKVGHKKLYIFDQAGSHHELQPLCLLDFYVHESRQRNGCGKYLFEHMLKNEGTTPGHLAYDRPSEKLLSFLKKHYDLEIIIPQSNNFVVYDRFFDNRPVNDSSLNKVSSPLYGRPAAGCSTRYKDIQASISRRATVTSRPHSSISKILGPNDAFELTEGSGDGGNIPELESPIHPTASSPLSCSASVEAVEDLHSHRDIKFEHQRLW